MKTICIITPTLLALATLTTAMPSTSPNLSKRFVGGVTLCKDDNFKGTCDHWSCEDQNLSKCMKLNIDGWNNFHSWRPDQQTEVHFFLGDGCKGDPWTKVAYPNELSHGSTVSQYWAETKAVKVFEMHPLD